MTTRQYAHQQRLVAEGRCRYGRDHDAPPPGKLTCAACRRRDTDRERRTRAIAHPERRQYSCGRCGGPGHNARACQATD